MWNKCLRSGDGGVIIGELVTSFMTTLGIKIGVNKGSIGVY